MKGLREIDRRIGYSLGALVALLGMVVPAVLPAFASADQLTSRSITMSTAVISASANYDILFTPTQTGKGYVTILFCSESPLIGNATCTPPTGFDAHTATLGSATTDNANVTIDDQATNNNTIVINENGASGTGLTASPTHIVLDGVTNPSVAHTTFYARIETFIIGQGGNTDDTQAKAAQASATTTGIQDWGGIALSTSDNIGVQAYVQESMSFCVSSARQAGDCGSGYADPSMTLGTTTGPETVLGSSLSTATDYAQLSTNAANGAVVNLKTDNTACGGLVLSFQSTTCGITPQGTTAATIASGAGKFGIQVGTASQVTSGGTASGTLEAANGSCYNGTGAGGTYCVDYTGSGTGIASAYGSPLLDTYPGSGSTNAPEAEQDIPITFAADAAPTTPAGKYVANLNMIAVGTF